MSSDVIVWFRRDLRLDDNLALLSAIADANKFDKGVIAVYLQDSELADPWAPGAASNVWCHHSLLALQSALEKYSSKLVIRTGDFFEQLVQICTESGADQIHSSRISEPFWLAMDQRLKEELAAKGIKFSVHEGDLLFDPFKIKTATQNPYRVFTPFWNTCLQKLEDLRPALDEPDSIPAPLHVLAGVNVEDLELLPKIRWDSGFLEHWRPGLDGANDALDQFIENAISEYPEARNFPSITGTSRLSPYLHFGEISPHRVLERLRTKNSMSQKALTARRPSLQRSEAKASSSSNSPQSSQQKSVQNNKDAEAIKVYFKEIGWREFAHHVLINFPHTPEKPLRSEFSSFPWRDNQEDFTAWKKGMTGYPLVDAGMRELWHTGWMHNRVRMVVASFLVKDLLLPWQWGARWFWDTLVDADLANNTLGWQWCGGCGADAAPYVRIFNPILQGEKFDADGEYISKWIPELSKLPNEFIQTPWTAPPLVLQRAELELGKTYPLPVVDHRDARKRALAALDIMQRAGRIKSADVSA